MKSKRLGSLIYRELYLGKKSAVTFISAMVMAITGIIILLSERYGNLRLLLDAGEEVYYLLDLFIKIIPVMALATAVVEISMAGNLGENSKWNNYRLSLPISGFEFSLAKHLIFGLVELVTLGISIGIRLLINYLVNESFHMNQIAFILAIHVLSVYMAFFMQFFLILFQGSQDKAGIAVVAVMGVSFLVINQLPESVRATFDFEAQGGILDIMTNLEILAGKNMDWILGIYLLCFLISFVCVGWLYERRVK